MLKTLRFIFAKSHIAVMMVWVGVFGWPPAQAAVESFTCPPYVMALSTTVAEVSAPWKVYSRADKAPLVSVGVFDGEPSDLAAIKPFATRREGGLTRVQWKFEGSYPQGKWLSCGYQGGAVSLARALPETASECAVSYSQSATGQPVPDSVVCK